MKKIYLFVLDSNLNSPMTDCFRSYKICRVLLSKFALAYFCIYQILIFLHPFNLSLYPVPDIWGMFLALVHSQCSHIVHNFVQMKYFFPLIQRYSSVYYCKPGPRMTVYLQWRSKLQMHCCFHWIICNFLHHISSQIYWNESLQFTMLF